MPRPRYSAMVLRNMNVVNSFGIVHHAPVDVPLLDICMESIVKVTKRRMAHFLDQAIRIRHRIQKVAFKPVQRLGRELDSHSLRVPRRRPQMLHAPTPFIVSATPSTKVADW